MRRVLEVKGRWVGQVILGLSLIACASCAGSPQPEPVLSPVVDLKRVSLLEAFSGTLNFHGEAQAITAGRGVIWGANLETSDLPSIAPVRSDGSFDLSLVGKQGDTVRLHWRESATLWFDQPLDIQIGPGPLANQTTSRGCVEGVELSILFETVRGAGSVDLQRTFRLTNDCPGSVPLTSVVFRRRVSEFTVDTPTLPLSIAPGSSADLTVHFAPASSGFFEDVVFFNLFAEKNERVALTVAGTREP